jgi:hypothetical protein
MNEVKNISRFEKKVADILLQGMYVEDQMSQDTIERNDFFVYQLAHFVKDEYSLGGDYRDFEDFVEEYLINKSKRVLRKEDVNLNEPHSLNW